MDQTIASLFAQKKGQEEEDEQEEVSFFIPWKLCGFCLQNVEWSLFVPLKQTLCGLSSHKKTNWDN